MYSQIPFDMVQAKTIKNLNICSELILLVFTDETFALAERTVDHDRQTYWSDVKNNDIPSYYYVLEQHGAMTWEEIFTLRRSSEETKKKAKLEQDRQEYERLKKVFEGQK